MKGWSNLVDINQLEAIKQASFSRVQLIFKHSTRCSLSSIVQSRLSALNDLNLPIDLHYLDLIQFRSVSNSIAELFQVEHESPQIIILYKSEATYDESHLDISIDEIAEHLEFLNVSE